MTDEGFDLLATVAAHHRIQHRQRRRAELRRALTALALLLNPWI